MPIQAGTITETIFTLGQPERESHFQLHPDKTLPRAQGGFLNELDRAIEQIGRLPNLAGPYVSGTRRYVVRRFPFTVVYREQAKIIEVVAIAHGRRKPGYWKERLKS